MEKILMKALGPDRQDSRYWFAEASKRANRKVGPEGVFGEKPEWLNISMLGARVAELKIYGSITEFPWVDGEVSASQIYEELNGLEADEIHVRINSPGGSVFEGLAIYSLLREQKAKVIGHIDGIAASAATFPALGCDSLSMCEGGQFMIHKPYTLEVGNSDEMRRTADILDKIESGMVALYQRKTKANKAEIRSMVSDETWMTAAEALEMGFVDSIAEEEEAEDDAARTPETVAQKISEPVEAQKDLGVGEEPAPEKIPHGAKARRLELFERQLTQN